MMKENARILIIEDENFYIDIMVDALKQDYQISVAKSGEFGLELAQGALQPDLILLDIILPSMNGFDVCRSLKKSPLTMHIPVIIISSKSTTEDETLCFEVGAVDFIAKPIRSVALKYKIENNLMLEQTKKILGGDNLVLKHRLNKRNKEITQAQDIAIMCLASLAETRDNETGNHIIRTQSYIRILATYLKTKNKFTHYLTKNTIELLYKSAPLHDIGKVGVPDSILLKPGKLDAREWEEMKRHTIYGYDSLLRVEKKMGEADFLKIAKEIVISHHERWDGSGYPYGLKGDEIPLSGQLMALADVYDALVCKRVYKKAFSHQDAVSLIVAERGKHFAPEVVSAFEQVQEDFHQAAIALSD